MQMNGELELSDGKRNEPKGKENCSDYFILSIVNFKTCKTRGYRHRLK